MNAVGQLLLLNQFLQNSYGTFYGFGVVHDLWVGRSWHVSGNFPRVELLRVVRDIGGWMFE